MRAHYKTDRDLLADEEKELEGGTERERVCLGELCSSRACKQAVSPFAPRATQGRN